jgi:hypothetical protein
VKQIQLSNIPKAELGEIMVSRTRRPAACARADETLLSFNSPRSTCSRTSTYDESFLDSVYEVDC